MNKLLSGKVREIYAADEKSLVILTTDRISAFDVVLPTPIPGKGVALNLISLHWFDQCASIVQNHILSADLDEMPAPFRQEPQLYARRTVLVKRLRMLPYEFIVRGYMFGSLWEEYQRSGQAWGQPLAEGYRLADRLERPLVTVAAKRSQGHDEPICLERLQNEIGREEADRLVALSLRLYERCYGQALERGLLIADTKFEFGYDGAGELVLGDELCTPDSSRYWLAEDWRPGASPRSLDKQFVRDYLVAQGLNGRSPGPELPPSVLAKTAQIYRQCCQRLTGEIV